MNPSVAEHTDSHNPAREKNIRSYNFKQPKLISKEVLRLLRGIHDLYIPHMRRMFSNVLNHPVEIKLANIEQINFSGYLNDIEPPAALYTFNVEELGDWAILQMDPGFCIYCVERQSGGYIQKIGPKRTLTRIEESIMERIVGRTLKELSHAWSSYIPFTIQHHVYESKPENIRTISAHTAGIVMHFQIEMGEINVPFSICYPFSLLKGRLVKEAGRVDDARNAQEPNSADKKMLENDLKKVPVDLQVILGSANVTLDKLIKLKEGDTILLDQPIGEPLKIKICDKVKMTGYPGSMNGNRAIKIFNISKTGLNDIDL